MKIEFRIQTVVCNSALVLPFCGLDSQIPWLDIVSHHIPPACLRIYVGVLPTAYALARDSLKSPCYNAFLKIERRSS